MSQPLQCPTDPRAERAALVSAISNEMLPGDRDDLAVVATHRDQPVVSRAGFIADNGRDRTLWNPMAQTA